MNNTFSLYPMLTRDLYEKIGYSASSYSFSYHSNQRAYPLKAKLDGLFGKGSNILQIIDERSEWNAAEFDICFEREYKINMPRFLFGDKGIAADNTCIGIALLWFSKTSNQRGAIEIGTINFDSVQSNYSVYGHFTKGQLYGTVVFRTVLFVKSVGKCASNHFAKKSGSLLGVLDEFKVVLDGSGSTFPIVEVVEPNQPLWRLQCQWEDPCIDGFEEEYICLCLNKANPAFKELHLENGITDAPFFMEILASAMQTLILKIKDDGELADVLNENNNNDGSIGQAVNYFINTLGWEYKSPDRLAYSIRKDFESRK